MSTTTELATLAMKKQGLTSQYALAQRLGISAQRVSNWFLKGYECDDEAACSLAELAGLKPEYAVLLIAMFVGYLAPFGLYVSF